MNHGSVRAIIIRDNKILLVKHAGQRDFWCLPGGTIETGETIKQTLIRELNEELGITNIFKLEFESVYEFARKDEKKIFVDFWFRVETNDEIDPLNASHGFELQDWKWFDLDSDVIVKPDQLLKRVKSSKGYINDVD